MSSPARFTVWLLIALFVGQTCALGQGRKKREITPARLEKLIRAATQGSPVVRPQAAQRLMKMGPVAHSAVLEHIASKTDLFAVGPELLEVAATLALPGEARTAALRVQFWKQVAQRDFPWRAALVSGLGKNPQAGEQDRFVELLGDRMLAVRLAALRRFSVGDSEDLLPILQARLLVETEGVARRALARRAVEAGHAQSLWVLFGELSRNDYFFDQPVGLIARLEAARDLKVLLPEGPAFDAQAPVDSESSVAQRAAWLAYLQPLAGLRQVSPEVRVQPAGEPLIGL
ncbi:MAG: hypothetical protein JKY61_11975, partial [Planctomycetes bacterium]|nr:hypothetical protein [Planctomycetota bacterium]